MPKQGQGDDSPGDRRRPFSSQGGPDGRHAETHDVRRERATNPNPPEGAGDDFDQDLAGSPHGGHDLARAKGAGAPGHSDDSDPAAARKELYSLLPELSREELDRLPILRTGTRLEQGAVYRDLGRPERGDFKAVGGRTAEPGEYLVAKAEVDYQLWDRLTALGR